MKKLFIQWTPQVICILYTIAINWFLLACFEIPNTFYGFVIFMMPVIIMWSVVSISSSFPAYGMVICPVIGIIFIEIAGGEGNLLYYGVVVLPLFFAGALYLIDDILYRKI